MLAGKAHPQDAEGQEMIRQWFEFARRPEVRTRVVFLSDYDVLMAEHLVQGVDVWVNTPRTALGSKRYKRHEGAGERRVESFRNSMAGGRRRIPRK